MGNLEGSLSASALFDAEFLPPDTPPAQPVPSPVERSRLTGILAGSEPFSEGLQGLPDIRRIRVMPDVTVAINCMRAERARRAPDVTRLGAQAVAGHSRSRREQRAKWGSWLLLRLPDSVRFELEATGERLAELKAADSERRRRNVPAAAGRHYSRQAALEVRLLTRSVAFQLLDPPLAQASRLEYAARRVLRRPINIIRAPLAFGRYVARGATVPVWRRGAVAYRNLRHDGEQLLGRLNGTIDTALGLASPYRLAAYGVNVAAYGAGPQAPQTAPLRHADYMAATAMSGTTAKTPRSPFEQTDLFSVAPRENALSAFGGLIIVGGVMVLVAFCDSCSTLGRLKDRAIRWVTQADQYDDEYDDQYPAGSIIPALRRWHNRPVVFNTDYFPWVRAGIGLTRQASATSYQVPVPQVARTVPAASSPRAAARSPAPPAPVTTTDTTEQLVLRTPNGNRTLASAFRTGGRRSTFVVRDQTDSAPDNASAAIGYEAVDAEELFTLLAYTGPDGAISTYVLIGNGTHYDDLIQAATRGGAVVIGCGPRAVFERLRRFFGPGEERVHYLVHSDTSPIMA